MKKKRVFSRIFAAALAVAIAAVTLITNSGMGLLVFADGEGTEATTEGNGSTGTYSVKIISPDVPADGKTYTYNFYQIIGGEVEADDGKNIIANPKWGEALGGDAFNNVPDGKSPEGSKYAVGDNIGVGYYPSSEVLLGALSGMMSCDSRSPGGSGGFRSSLTDSAYTEYNKILNSYGVSSNYFFQKFKYDLQSNGSYSGSPTGSKTRDVKGLVELLNAGLTDGTLKTADLKAFADLLLNGVKVNIQLNADATDTEEYTYNFITGSPQATQKVESSGTYTVGGLAPGYYLVTCVGEDNELTNNGYDSAMPIKPVSTMLVLVGPANGGVAEIVGKNAYSVPTVTLDMYQKPVKLTKKIEINCPSSYNDYTNEVNDIDNIIKDDTESSWKNTGSFDYYEKDDRQEAILYRIGITLPLNFDSYKNSGYFLAVLDQYNHFNYRSTNGEIHRVENVRPYVYVKKSNSDDYNLVGRYMGSKDDNNDTNVIGKYTNTIRATLTDNNNATYDNNEKFGFDAHDIFCFGDLYNYTTNEECTFAPGDTIYICYPAILDQTNVKNNEKYLLNVNRIWAVYSNNPNAKKLTTANGQGTGNGYSHVVNGEVGVSPIAEANVNTYGVTLKVDGENGYTNGAKFALYRVVGEGEKATKEYAYASSGINCYVKYWIPESKLQDKLLNYTENSFFYGNYAYLTSSTNGIFINGIKIRGLAAGKYYLQELTISSNGVESTGDNVNNPNHSNLKEYHYELTKEPITFNVANKYNDSVNGYMGKDDNQKTFIKELTVDFYQENPERAIDTYIDKPNNDVDEENKPVSTKNGSITTTLNSGSPTVYATEDGQIEILVYHKTINLIWLPETGGIGTTIFFIVGGMIVMTAVVMIITRFRIKRERL